MEQTGVDHDDIHSFNQQQACRSCRSAAGTADAGAAVVLSTLPVPSFTFASTGLCSTRMGPLLWALIAPPVESVAHPSAMQHLALCGRHALLSTAGS